MEIGIHTFGVVPDPHTGRRMSAQDRLREVIRMAVLADEVRLDVFGFGEHHRLDFPASAPPVALAAVAQATGRIRLTSTATVLSTADPVRVFEEFATLDLLSGGRAEIIAGRGAFVESFALFGYDLDDYDALFAEKLDLLLYQHEALGHHRFIGQIDIGGLPFAKVATAIELLGTVVAPAVRRALAAAQPGGQQAQAADR